MYPEGHQHLKAWIRRNKETEEYRDMGNGEQYGMN